MNNNNSEVLSQFSIYPDECAFSASWRFQSREGIKTYRACRLRDSFIHAELPSNIEQLSYDISVSADELISKHTAWSLYSLSLGEGFDINLKEAMLGSHKVSTIVRLARLPSSKDGVPQTYRICPDCYINDIRRTGIAYFHIDHHLPGVVACYQHHRALHQVQCKSIARNFTSKPDFKRTNKPCYEQIEYAEFCANLKKFLGNNARLDVSNLVLSGLRESGLLYSDIRVDTQSFSEKFERYIASLNLPHSFKIQKVASRYLHDRQSYPSAPIKLILLLSFLFKDIQTLKNGLSIKINKSKREFRIDNLSEECLVVEKLKVGASISQTAKYLGRSRCFVKRIARQNGLIDGIEQYLGAHVYKKAKDLALLGVDTEVIANKLGISKGAAERVISENKIIKAARAIKRFQKRKNLYRSSLLETVVLLGHYQLRTDVKTANNTAYCWLFKHDRTWLESIVSKPSIPLNPVSRAKAHGIDNDD